MRQVLQRMFFFYYKIWLIYARIYTVFHVMYIHDCCVTTEANSLTKYYILPKHIRIFNTMRIATWHTHTYIIIILYYHSYLYLSCVAYTHTSYFYSFFPSVLLNIFSVSLFFVLLFGQCTVKYFHFFFLLSTHSSLSFNVNDTKCLSHSKERW